MPLKVRRRYFGKMGLRIPQAQTAANRINSDLFPHLENVWLRSKPGELRNVGRRRRPTRAGFDLPNPNDRSLVHTHLISVYEQNPRSRAGSYPSVGDIDTMFQMIHRMREKYNIRFWQIATTNRDGEVIGYFTLHTPVRFIRWVLDEKTTLPDPEGTAGIGRSRSYLLQLQQKGLKLSATAMPGYYFRHGIFKPFPLKK